MRRTAIDTTRSGQWARAVGCGLTTLVMACGGPAQVRLGVVLPLSGPDARCGLAIRDGVLLAHEERGMTPELEVELRIADSGGDPRRGAELLASLYDGGAVAALGGVAPEEALAMVSVAEKSRRVLLSPSPASLATDGGRMRQSFRLAQPAVQEGSALARFVGDTLGLHELLVAGDSLPSSIALRAIVERSLAARGVTIVEGPPLAPAESSRVELVEAVQRSGAEAVLLVADSAIVGAVVATLDRTGFAGAILTTSAFVVGGGGEVEPATEGVFVPLPAFDVAAEDGSLQPFIEAFHRRYDRLPNLCAANGYDAMTLLVESLRRGGPSPAGVWKGLRAIRDFPGARRSLQFDERGEILDFPRIHRVEREGLVDYEDWLRSRRDEIGDQIRRLQERRLRLLEELGGG